MAIAHLYEMNTKLKEEGFKCLSLLISCWHIDEKIRLLTNVNIPKPKGRNMSTGN
jgi:hypothetical protein